MKADMGLPKPDMVCYLDVSDVVARDRGDYGRERYEEGRFQKRVKSNYELLMDSSWVRVGADESMMVVEEKLFSCVRGEVERKGKKELGKLWVRIESSYWVQ